MIASAQDMVTLNVWHVNETEFDAVIDAFEAQNPNVSIEFQYYPWGAYFDNLQTAYAGGTPPDVHRQDDDEIPFFVDDAKSEEHFDDVVALNCRALLPQGVENLVVGGRCISCDHLSQASIRGAATCMTTGHGCGSGGAQWPVHAQC